MGIPAVKSDLKRIEGRRWLPLVLLACLQTGCAMCANDFDDFYGAYGGSVCRDDMVCGRVNSIIRPARRLAMAPADCDCGPQGQPGSADNGMVDEMSPMGSYESTYDEQGASHEAWPPYENETERPYELTPGPTSESFGVQPTTFTIAPAEEDWGDGLDGDELGYDEEPVEVYEPNYGYDDDVDASRASSTLSDEPVGEAADEPADDAMAVSVDDHHRMTPIGSGVATNTLRSGPPRTLRQLEEKLPPSASPDQGMPTQMPLDDYIDRLVPLSAPPTPGFLSAPPNR